MNYDLAKQLKDAGFPITEHDGDGLNPDYPFFISLSELISELGVKFGKLDHVLEFDAETWFAYSSKIENELNIPAYIVKQGSTPEEAVAKLWLSLNIKG